MTHIFLEPNGEEHKAFESILVKGEDIAVLNNPLARKIITTLKKQNACALDIARELKENEQKIYYHLRKLQQAGIVKLVGIEKRAGMTANIFSVVSPIVATKLYDDGFPFQKKEARDITISKFLHPFIENGKFNAKIIIGNPYPHGQYEKGAHDAAYAIDIAHFFGNYANSVEFPCYKTDTQLRESDLQQNLIVIGNPMVNTLANKINDHIPVFFEKKDWSVISKQTNKTYTDDAIGIIARIQNPFAKDKQILLLAGKRSRGTIASIIAFTKNIDKVMKQTTTPYFGMIIKGIDKDGDDCVDYARFME